MKFTCDIRDLFTGVASIIKALPVRTPMPVLEGVHMEAGSDGLLRMVCSDTMLEKEYTMAVDVLEPGKAIVPGKKLGEILPRLSDGQVTISVAGNQMRFEDGRGHSRAVLQVIEYGDYPRMSFDGDTYSLTLDREELREIIDRTAFATSQEDSRPMLTGALFELGENLTVVATDAYQFAMRTLPLKTPAEEHRCIIPTKAMQEISRMTDETEADEVQILFTRSHVRVAVDHAALIARLISGDYIPYRNILPKESKTRVLANREDLIRAVDLAQVMAREGSNSIIMKFSNNSVSVSANGASGTIDESVPVQIVGEDIEIAFNPRYCLNILKSIPDENVYLEMNSSISPCVVRPVQDNGRYYYLIVPVRIYSRA